jgi:hypothetical protein
MRREQGRHSDITHKKYFTNASIKNNPWFTDPFYMKALKEKMDAVAENNMLYHSELEEDRAHSYREDLDDSRSNKRSARRQTERNKDRYKRPDNSGDDESDGQDDHCHLQQPIIRGWNHSHAVMSRSDSRCSHKHRGDRAEAVKKSHKKKRKELRSTTLLRRVDLDHV